MGQLKEVFNHTNFLKKEFQKIETKTWTTKDFGKELIVQVGHLGDMLLKQEVKYNPYTLEDNNKRLGDELADIVLNTFSIFKEEDIPEASFLNTIGDITNHQFIKENLEWEEIGKVGLQTHLTTLNDINQISDTLFQKIAQYSYDLYFITQSRDINKQQIVDTAAQLTLNSLALGYYMELDLSNYFSQMVNESQDFIATKSRVIRDSYQYKTPPTELIISESALPFLEEPPHIDLPQIRPQPFLLVRSSGLPFLNNARHTLRDYGLTIDHERTTNDFELLARYLYPAKREAEESYLWFLVSRKAHPDTYNQGHAFVLDPKHLADYEQIVTIKRQIRQDMGPTPYKVSYRGKTSIIDLHHIHAPDETDLDQEFKYLTHFSQRID